MARHPATIDGEISTDYVSGDASLLVMLQSPADSPMRVAAECKIPRILSAAMSAIQKTFQNDAFGNDSDSSLSSAMLTTDDDDDEGADSRASPANAALAKSPNSRPNDGFAADDAAVTTPAPSELSAGAGPGKKSRIITLITDASRASASALKRASSSLSTLNNSYSYDDDDEFEAAPRPTSTSKRGGRKAGVSRAPAASSSASLVSHTVPFPSAEVELEKILYYRANVAPAVTEAVSPSDAASPALPLLAEEFFIKFKNRSYLHCEWVARDWIETNDRRGKQRVKHFLEKTMADLPYGLLSEERPFNESFIKIDRIISSGRYSDPFTAVVDQWYLVKWSSLAYDQCTWECRAVLINECDDAEYHIDLYEAHNSMPNVRVPGFFDTFLPPGVRRNHSEWKKLEESPVYKDGNLLRAYQLEGLNWLTYCWHHNQSSLIADEMGLGKTVQSIAFLNELFKIGVRGPFLIVAPLSTIPHWERTVTSWTDMNAVVFHGSAVARGVIQKYEFHYTDPNGKKLTVVPPPGKGKFASQYKFDVLITTYEMAMNSAAALRNVGWRVVVVDEAHRLKNKTSKVGEILKTYSFEHRLLLTGTPIQNSLEELWSILNFLDVYKFPDNSERSFLSEYDLRSAADVQRLQELLKPIMLRRLKEDVEKSIPSKEETIIEVELTDIQRAYYRAILERNFPFLRQGTKRQNLPNLINAMMELRKCCIHPYLLRGAEEKIIDDAKATSPQEQFECMIQASGKLVLLNKLLPKLKSDGHRVLIFSQMTKCLDLLGDYLRGRGYLYERIDGNVRGEGRQAAIDRFSAPDSQIFCFLLCTRAGGVGINLTAADTCIIFDSDWNPQNDLQAQARCHRIGQKKSVSIYRLITRNSYERTMFDKAGMKLGLDKAVLSRMEDASDLSGGGNGAPSSLSKTEIEELLRRGAYAAVMSEDPESLDESKKFCEEDIDSILSRRTQVIRTGGDADESSSKPRAEGSLFSKATFSLESNVQNLDVNDPDFWEKWAQKANVDTGPVEEDPNAKLILASDSKRRRRRAETVGSDIEGDGGIGKIGAPSDIEVDETGGRAAELRTARMRLARELSHTTWTLAEKIRVERGLMLHGYGAWEKKIEQFPKRTIQDLKAVELRLIKWCLAKLKREKILYESRGGDQHRKAAAKESSAMDLGSDIDDDGPAVGKEKKIRTRDDNRPQKDDPKLYVDIEYILATPHWEVPEPAEVVRMTRTTCQESFKKLDYQISVDPELGAFPYPGATKTQLLEYRSFLDDASKDYFDHLEKKPRNLLLRVQALHFLRMVVFDIDPHAVSEIWVSASEYSKAVSALTETEPASPGTPWVDKYQELFVNRQKAFSFSSSYEGIFLTPTVETASNAVIPGWFMEEDRDLILGMVKNGYQSYDKIRADQTLVFSKKHWVNAGAQPVLGPSGNIISFVWPGGGEVGTRVRRLNAFLNRSVKDNRPMIISAEGAATIPETSVSDLSWARKDRSEFMRAVNCLGLPLLERVVVPVQEAAENKWPLAPASAANPEAGMVTVLKRDWADFKELASLEHKTDYSMENFCRLFVRKGEEMVRAQSPKGLTLDMCVSGRLHADSATPAGVIDTFPPPDVILLDPMGGAADPCEGMALERARRLLRRIVFMRSLRLSVWEDPHIDFKLSFAKKSAGLPDWWVLGTHDKAFLLGICKHGMTPLRQNRLMFDPELPFHTIVKEKLAAAGLGDQLPTLIQRATKTKHEINQIKRTEAAGDDTLGDGDDEQAATAGDLNLEDIVGWPKDLIRSRRVEILMDLITSPSPKVANMLQYFGREAAADGNKRRTDDDFQSSNQGELLSGLTFGRKVKRMRLEEVETVETTAPAEDLNAEDVLAIDRSLSILRRAVKVIKQNQTSKTMALKLKQFLAENENDFGTLLEVAAAESAMDVDGDADKNKKRGEYDSSGSVLSSESDLGE